MLSTLLALGLLAAQPPVLLEDGDFVAGRAAYDGLDPAKAAKRFTAAAAVEGRSDTDRAIILVWLGLAKAQLMDFDATGRAFREAARLDPDVGLPGDPSPKIVELMAKARAAHARSTGAPVDTPAPVATPAEEPAPPDPESVPPLPADDPEEHDSEAAEADARIEADTTVDDTDPSTEPVAEQTAPTDEGAPELNAWMLGSGVAVGVAVLSAGGGALFGVQAAMIQDRANQPDVTQVQAAESLDSANTKALSLFLAEPLYGQ